MRWPGGRPVRVEPGGEVGLGRRRRGHALARASQRVGRAVADPQPRRPVRAAPHHGSIELDVAGLHARRDHRPGAGVAGDGRGGRQRGQGRAGHRQPQEAAAGQCVGRIVVVHRTPAASRGAFARIERMSVYDLVIVGAGPAGLAASIAAKGHGLRHVVLEKGAVVNTILHFPLNMVFFTTPELLEIGNLPFVTPYEKPTRIEALRYYRRVVEAFELPLEMGQTVTSVTREDDHFVVATTTDAGRAALGGAHRRHRHRGLRPAEPHGHPGRGPAARVALLHGGPRLLPQERGRRRRRQLDGRRRPRDVSRRRQGDDRPPRRGLAQRPEVLGAAGPREPHQGRRDRRAPQGPRHPHHAPDRRDPARRRHRGVAAGRGRVPADRLSLRHDAAGARRRDVRSGGAGAGATMPRRSRPTCPAST